MKNVEAWGAREVFSRVELMLNAAQGDQRDKPVWRESAATVLRALIFAGGSNSAVIAEWLETQEVRAATAIIEARGAGDSFGRDLLALHATCESETLAGVYATARAAVRRHS